MFDAERAVYEENGFITGTFTTFTLGGPDLGGFSAAHLFPDAASAEAAFDVVNTWHHDPFNLALVFGGEPDDFTDVTNVDTPVGDQSAAFVARGQFGQVFVVIWRTENIVHIVRAFMAADDAEGVGTVETLVQTIADRT